ncbi:primosomal protein N' (replication factor Y) - superfamily II helicase [Marivivens donghaensis]|uniref:primosomal protein N' (replication factor Y) - superfamily II helicase n=1 Tax=Marivivens donghaensis TaxID=1699413 RepID=UPI00201EEBFA|nr:primosomal protein N' (replication factor Y) - superfamily II helicase [Marivivens donghaensis]MCL7407791.1 primosomal protein N' (replication factor Y) - superfamily II helicase [Marivivens donghaensis]MDN3704230.1 primosomal protein N' (replication factor Y) - superfamily II helicase [Marivivens donghaensis]
MTVQEHRFPCEQCGADLRFDPVQNKLVCDFCGHSEAVEKGDYAGTAIKELDFEQAIRHQLPQAEIEETRVSTCPNCGAQVEIHEKDHAVECPFCATPVVTDTGTHRHIKPKALLPFGLDEKQARDAMTKWLGQLWFAPNGLQEYARKGRKLNGIYVPYWTYDADTKSSYTGERGDDYYTTHRVVRNGKSQTVRQRHTKWRRASGRVARFFDDVLVLASKSLPKRYTDGLQPWNLSELQPYSPDFLAGFRAEGYQISLEDGYTEARAYMDAMILRDVKFDIGGDRQKVHSINTTISDVTFKHILLPVWLAAYKYRGKTYRFVVNGQTGKVQGERPYSAWKIAFASIIGLIVAAGVGYIVAQNK